MRLIGKIIIKLLLVLFVLFMLGGVISAIWQPGEEPSPEKAGWAIQTYSNDAFRIPSRVYLATEVKYLSDGTPQIKSYWTYDGKSWHHKSGEKQFPIMEYGKVTIKKRIPVNGGY